MIESLQKSANRLCELPLAHPGILDLEEFANHFQLHCYEPSADLRPFVTHIWTQRRKISASPIYRPTEILSGPNVYLFFTNEGSFIHGILPGPFEYKASTAGLIAGVKFRPGGFYPFLRRSMSDLSKRPPALEQVFPEATKGFVQALLAQRDETVVANLEKLLRHKLPAPDKNIEFIHAIMTMMTADEGPYTTKAIAQAVGRSERSLQLLFRVYVGVSLKWVLMRRRLLRTVQQISSGSAMSWVEAAAELGYSSQSHFVNEFKRIVGQSPSHYSKAITKAAEGAPKKYNS